MKSSYKFMQGASKSTGKSLDLKGFFACHFVFLPKFVPKILYSQNKRVSFKESKKPPRGWFFFINRQTLRL